MTVIHTFAIFTVLCAAGATSCQRGECDLRDETSFVQFQNTVNPGSERGHVVYSGDLKAQQDAELAFGEPLTEDLSEDELLSIAAQFEDGAVPTEDGEPRVESDQPTFEAFTLEEDAGPTPPPGCQDAGCFGDGPNCGGNAFDCTSRGLVVSGWYKSCSSNDVCQTGYKVRCAKCPAGGGSPPAMPTGAPLAPVNAPPLPTAAPSVTGPPAVQPVLPTDQPVFPAIPYDPQGVKFTTGNLTIAKKNYTTLTTGVSNATNYTRAVQANVSLFAAQEKAASALAVQYRASAVKLARKVALANVTVFKGTKAMAGAYYAQKGAAQGAQDALARKNNYDQQKMYYQKQLVDQVQTVVDAQAALRVGQAAIAKARSDLAIAKGAAADYRRAANKANAQKMSIQRQATKVAQQQSVTLAKEGAYIESSVGRTQQNVPPGGANAGVSP